MKNKIKLPLTGRGRLTARDRKTGKIVYQSPWKEHLVVLVGKELVARMLIDEPGYDTGLTYCAIGNDDTAPTLSQTTLVAEQVRNLITDKSRASNEMTLSTFFGADEGNIYIKEVGIFGHSTANGSVDTGVMFDRWLEDFDNTSGNYDITLDYVSTVGG